MDERTKLLVISVERDLCFKIATTLESEPYDIEFSRCIDRGLTRLQQSSFDLVIADQKTSGVDSRFVQSVKELHPNQPFLLIAPSATDVCIMSNQIKRTFTSSDLIERICSAIEMFRAPLKDLYFHTEPQATQEQGFGLLTGTSQEMQVVYQNITDCAQDDLPLLITGERGTGKALKAKMVHQLGPRNDQPFIEVDCSTLKKESLAAEVSIDLGGSCTGTFFSTNGLLSLAGKGTLFLREISNLTLETQNMLAHMLCNRPVCRLIASSSRNLKQLAAAGVFSADLLNTLSKGSIQVPPLRDRPGDIPLLAWHIIRRSSKTFDKEINGISSRAMRLLHCYRFPGNVREFTYIVNRAVALAENRLITARDLELENRMTSTLSRTTSSSERHRATRSQFKARVVDDVVQAYSAYSFQHRLANRDLIHDEARMLRADFQAVVENSGLSCRNHVIS